MIDRNFVENIKKKYPPETRISLIHMEDPYNPVPCGTYGTVRMVDDAGQIHVKWDNGRGLALNVEIDEFEVI